MGRKRLTTILLGIGLCVGVPAGAASAQTIPLPGLGGIDLGPGGDDEDCLEIGVDLELGDLLGLDPSVCVLDEDGDLVDIEGGASVGDQDVPVGEVTQPVEDAVNEGARAVTGGNGGGGDDRPDPEPEPEPAPRPDPDRGDDAGGSGGGGTGGGGSATTPDPAPAPEEPETAEPAPIDRDAFREQQLASLRALRSDLSSGALRETGVLGPVGPGITGAGSLLGEAAAPEVAGSQVTPGIAGGPADDGGSAGDDGPVIASPEQEQALLATSGAVDTGEGAPLALKLLAGALVLGASAVWLVARRELGSGPVASA